MSGNLIAGNALLISAMLPLLQVGIGVAMFWHALKRPFFFVVVGLVILYLVMVACVTPVLSKVGISGVRPGAPAPAAIGPADIKLLIAFALFLTIGTGVLWGLKLIWAKP